MPKSRIFHNKHQAVCHLTTGAVYVVTYKAADDSKCVSRKLRSAQMRLEQQRKKKQKYSKTTENVFNISTNGCYCSPRAGPTRDAVNMETNAGHVEVDAGVTGYILGMKTWMHRLLAP